MRLAETVFLITLGVLFSGGTGVDARVGGGVNGGSNCAACTMAAAILEQLSEIHNETVVKAMERVCSYLPDQFQNPCKDFVDFIGPFLPEYFSDKENPDTLCHALTFCSNDPGYDKCYAYPPPQSGFDSGVSLRKHIIKKRQLSMAAPPDVCHIPGIKEICDWIDNALSYHDPAVDIDGDRFSTYESLRGSSWRGKDCNDANRDFHPGAVPLSNDVTEDSNCNGIYGSDPASGRPYEDVLCGGTSPRGVAVLGDSISAHFHLPEEWFDSQKLSGEVFKHLAFIIENEIDWPQMSTITGHGNNSWSEVIRGPIDSIYQRLTARNRCNHRDYQNEGVNGGDSKNMVTIQESLMRDRVKDKPMLVFYAVVGNDVCNRHWDTFAEMTTPAEMRNNSMNTLKYLDKMLPPGSHVHMIGLADGRILYDSLHNRTHPLGRLKNDFTYATFYNFLNCLDISPCRGWMQTNETIRNMTTQRAVELSDVLKDIADTHAHSFASFNLTYMPTPFTAVFQDWVSKGGEGWQLIEPVDGFHINQVAQGLYTKAIWDFLEKNAPGALGPVNPNNAKILSIFGNQGGL